MVFGCVGSCVFVSFSLGATPSSSPWSDVILQHGGLFFVVIKKRGR